VESNFPLIHSSSESPENSSLPVEKPVEFHIKTVDKMRNPKNFKKSDNKVLQRQITIALLDPLNKLQTFTKRDLQGFVASPSCPKQESIKDNTLTL
jgi:hypothetical protein